MLYLIDGYNLLFSISDFESDFSLERQQLIRSLNDKIQLTKLNAAIVFDAHYCPGYSKRTHYNHLEILFSGEGETADDLILKVVEMASSPQQYTVVTSDNRLAWKARRLGAKTEKVGAFLTRLEKKYLNLQSKSREPSLLPSIKKKETPKPSVVKKVKKPPPEAPPQECFEYYLYLFEKKINEKSVKKEKRVSDMDRWLKIFEEKFKEESHGA